MNVLRPLKQKLSERRARMDTMEDEPWMAEERESARDKLLAEVVPAAIVHGLLSEAQAMHEAQTDCAARMVGEAPKVQVH